MTELMQLPVLPLRDTVLFPETTTPVVAGRRGTVKAIQAALDSDGPSRVFVVSQVDAGAEVLPERLHTVGTVATILQVQKSPGRFQVVLQGDFRGIALRYRDQEKGYLHATVRAVEDMQPIDSNDAAFVAMQREVQERAAELARHSGFPEEYVEHVLGEVESAGALADAVGGSLDIAVDAKQKLLETLSVEERLRRVLIQVQRQLSVHEAQQHIQSKVQEELGDRQREMVLREQLRAIQDELGEGDSNDDLEELREKLNALDLKPEVRKEIDRDLSRLLRLSPESMEYQANRTYLETVAELPWNQRSEGSLELRAARKILEEDHHGLQEVKDRVLEFLAVLKLRSGCAASNSDGTVEADTTPEVGDATSPAQGAEPASNAEGANDEASAKSDRRASLRSPILLFVGPPGVGKTSIAKSIARSLGREYVRMSLGGVRDEADIRGHRRTYVGAMPGRIVQGMRQAGTQNPVMLLDEVDKLGVSMQGDPASALLEVLDPAQNSTFIDHYLGVPFDLSEVLFVATANFIDRIPGPLLDRMEIVEFSGYTEAEKRGIAERYLIPRQLENNGLDARQLQLDGEALEHIISRYTREAGVRQLEQQLGKLARKIAYEVAMTDNDKERSDSDDSGLSDSVDHSELLADEARIGPAKVRRYLGRPRVQPERATLEDELGVATGMYYTPVGGDIMFVEASTMRGKGQLQLTGQLGDVMRESGLAAWTYAKAHAAELGIAEERFDVDVHLHVPAGAIPKDGPSAGVTLATALISALSGVKARNDIAMTGEITLTGRVLPVGGVKEKVLGAVRAGIRKVVLPKENVDDLEDIPQATLRQLQVFPVETLAEVLELALRGGVVGRQLLSV